MFVNPLLTYLEKNMEILVFVVGFAVSAFTAFSFYKAGAFKLKSTKEQMLQAGFGWLENQSVAVAKLIGLLEVLGAVGLILAPIGYLAGLDWAIFLAIAAGVGLALTMVGAIWVHGARGETKYTIKMTGSLLGFSSLSSGLWALPLFI